MCVCVCVCVCERDRERERVCVCVKSIVDLVVYCRFIFILRDITLVNTNTPSHIKHHPRVTYQNPFTKVIKKTKRFLLAKQISVKRLRTPFSSVM